MDGTVTIVDECVFKESVDDVDGPVLRGGMVFEIHVPAV